MYVNEKEDDKEKNVLQWNREILFFFQEFAQ